MPQPQLTEQDQEAWELYCDGGGTWPTWESLDPRVQQKYRLLANEARMDRSQPWRHA